MLVDVEVLDVNDDEARALLLSIDPLASLAETQESLHRRVPELTPAPSSPELELAWREALTRASPSSIVTRGSYPKSRLAAPMS